MACRKCQKRAEKWEALMQERLPICQKRFEEFLKSNPVFIPTVHALKRLYHRAINRIEMEKAIRAGFVIEEQGKDRWLIWSNIKTGKGQYRTVHIVLSVENGIGRIISVIDPADPEKRHHWNEDFTRRVCWCEQSN